jgi:6,7-dimethyl-8-ribityllumazine synthase
LHSLREITINDLAAFLLIIVWLVGVIVLTLVSQMMPDAANGAALIAIGWLFRGQTNGKGIVTNAPIKEIVP